MTMPHLMNCPHHDSGWCLDCVKKLHDDAEYANVDGFNTGVDVAYGKFIRNLHASVAGKVVRGRSVAGVEVLVEIIEGDNDPRYFVQLVFTEKRYAESVAKEQKLVNVIFDESPKFAWRHFTEDEFVALLSGMDSIDKYEWRLEDE